MAKTKTKTKTTDANTTASRAYASEKFAPAIAQVVAAQGTARNQFASDIESAKNAAESGKAYALNAIPNVQKTYNAAMTKADADNAFINAEMAKLGPAADIFKGANLKSQGSEHDRVTAAGADAEQGLRDRATAAEAGKQFASNEARATYRKTTGALRQQLFDLRSQAGNAAANKLSDLLQADLNRQKAIDVAHIGAGATTGAAQIRADAQANKEAAAKAKDTKDIYGNTLDQRRSRRSTFQNAVSIGQSLTYDKAKKRDRTPDEIYRLLLIQSPTINNTVARGAASAAANNGVISDVGLRKALRKMGIMVTAPTPTVTGGQRQQTPSNTPGQQRPT